MKTRLGDLNTRHIWYLSLGAPTGADLIAEEGEELYLPSESWWDLMGTLTDGRWQWDGEGNPRDFNGNTVQNLVAFVRKA